MRRLFLLTEWYSEWGLIVTLIVFSLWVLSGDHKITDSVQAGILLH